MLKWAVGKDDRPINPTKSLKKRLKQVDTQKDVGLIGGGNNVGSKHRNVSQGLPGPQQSRVISDKKEVRAPSAEDSGVISNNSKNNNNSSDNGIKVNGDNYKGPISPTSHNNNNIDSKSLLYMSLDHLPMAIVKQYERMLQDAPTKPPPKSVLKPQPVSFVQKKKGSSNNSKTNSNSNGKSKPKGRPTNTQSSKKSTLSKSITFKVDAVDANEGRNEKESSPQISIKEAHNRPIKALSTSASAPVKKPHVEETPTKIPNDSVYPKSNKENFVQIDPKFIKKSSCDTKNNTQEEEIPHKAKKDKKETEPSMQKAQAQHSPHPIKASNEKLNEPQPVSRLDGVSKQWLPSHDTTDPEFLEKPITYLPKCAKKLTLKRSELKKLERLKTQTERLNRFLKKYYHDCLPNLPEEEETQCSPEEKSVRLSILETLSKANFLQSEDSSDNENNTCYENVSKSVSASRPRFPYSNPKLHFDKFSPIHASSFISYTNLPELSVDDYTVTWENLLNSSGDNSASTLVKSLSHFLPVIEEDSAEISSNSSISHGLHHQQQVDREKEVARRENILSLDETYLMSRSEIPKDDSLVHLTRESLLLHHRDGMSNNKGDEAEGGFGIQKLKDLFISPLGDELFDASAPALEDEGFMSPPPEAYSPASSTTSTFNRFSLSSKESSDDCDKDEESNLKHENPNYLFTTWNSHAGGEGMASPCGPSISPRSTTSLDSSNANYQRENEESTGLAEPFSRPKRMNLPQLGKKMNKRRSTPRKVVRKPQAVSTGLYSGKGELLLKTYKNDGDYVTVHVLQARRLEPQPCSSWKLLIKVSVLPELDETFTQSAEAVVVERNRACVKIDQKFSFEIPEDSNPKIFLTVIKRSGKKSSFLGWNTLSLSSRSGNEAQHWVKLRKRKMMNTSTAMVHSYPGKRGVEQRSCSSMDSPSPQPHPDNASSSSSSRGCDCELDVMILPKSQLQNSSTMDSGVEDCCEPPPPPAPSIDLDDKNGQRVGVKMTKPDRAGYGFSVVWVTPPRIERLEKGKAADIAGLRIGDLIIGVNGEDVTAAPNTTIYTKMKTTGNELELEVWRTTPPIQSRSGSQHHQILPETLPQQMRTGSKISTVAAVEPCPRVSQNINESVPKHRDPSVPLAKATTINNANNNNGPVASTSATTPVPIPSKPGPGGVTVTKATIQQPSSTPPLARLSCPPPTSILKPPPPAPPPITVNGNGNQTSTTQSQSGSSAWRIRFNIELLDNEDECLKQFFICELKFFRKVVAALDRYLIPVQSNRLLTPQEINLTFSHVIKIITVTKRILNCVVSGSSASGWKLGDVLLSTHKDHLSEFVSVYSAYAKSLGCAAMILSDKMSIQEFTRFVLETPVPKGHLDMTGLLFAPLEHLRNICEIAEEITNNNEKWGTLFTPLKECYADIVCETDFMEPISHISMKKNPLLSVRDLEKRVVSTSCQPVKVCDKGRRWLFGSRLFKKETDGSWSPVWAFLFTDIIVLTSHTTRDRVFFVKENPIRLEDVVTLHFNLPKKHENEFRLLFEPEPVYTSRLDKLLPLHRNKKSSQIALRAPNIQLKSMWKLLLQKQIITLNTRLSKSASSNFSISEFCERFPITPQGDEENNEDDVKMESSKNRLSRQKSQGTASDLNPHKFPSSSNTAEKPQKSYAMIKPYAPDGLSSLSKEMLRSRVTRIIPPSGRSARVEVIPEEIKASGKPHDEPSDTIALNECSKNQDSNSTPINSSQTSQTACNDNAVNSTNSGKSAKSSPSNENSNNNNNEPNKLNNPAKVMDKCPCASVQAHQIKDTHLNQGASNSTESASVAPNSSVCPSPKLLTPPRAQSPKVDRQVERVQAAVNATPSPSKSVSNNRVEALKYEGVSPLMLRSKPGSKIMTNATLKSQLLAQQESQTIITMVESPQNSNSNSDCILISQQIEPSEKKASNFSPLAAPRCSSANGFVKPKTVHTDSPILTGFGSDKGRRRILYDYKIQRDYPELFGISPKDRRSFIKQLAEKAPENEKPLIAPYYFSPISTPKFPKKLNESEIKKQDSTTITNEQKPKVSALPKNPVAETSNAVFASTSRPLKENDARFCLLNEVKERLEIGESSLRSTGRSRLLRGRSEEEASDDEEEEEDEEDDTDNDSDECHDEQARAQAQHRQRSPEESSNDSGISDELTEKSKATNNSSATQAPQSNSAEVKYQDKTKIMPKTAHASFTPKESSSNHHVCFEGEETTGVEAVVVLRADKCTETDDSILTPTNRSPRSLMAARREAFFSSPSHSLTSSPFKSNSNKVFPARTLSDSPLKVKILDGGVIQSTKADGKGILHGPKKSFPAERVQLTRFPEKERNAKLERVESSDDSTSSDVASASPAAENGTTDPSWSSSSSSLGGCNSSSNRDEQSSSISTATSIFTCPINNDVSPITKIFMSDFSTGGIPTTSVCEFANVGRPEIVVTQESPDTPTVRNQEDSSSNEGESENGMEIGEILARNGKGFLRVESNDSTAENFGDEDDYNFDDDEEDLSQCSAATINRYGTYESLEKIDGEEGTSGVTDFSKNTMTRSKARFTFDDDSDDDTDLFEEDFESDFNFRFPSQIQDNTYSVSRLGPLPPLLEEDYEDDLFEEQKGGSSSSHNQAGTSAGYSGGNTLRTRHEAGLRQDNGFLLARLATMYARSSISPLKILRDLWIKKRYRQSQDWRFKE